MTPANRIATIADEAFGPFPVQSIDANLDCIEQGITSLRMEPCVGLAIRKALRHRLAHTLWTLRTVCRLYNEKEPTQAEKGMIIGMRQALCIVEHCLKESSTAQGWTLTEGEAETERLALAEFMWERFDRYQLMNQKGFKFSDGREPTKEEIEKAWNQYKTAEKLRHRLDEKRKQ